MSYKVWLIYKLLLSVLSIVKLSFMYVNYVQTIVGGTTDCLFLIPFEQLNVLGFQRFSVVKHKVNLCLIRLLNFLLKDVL